MVSCPVCLQGLKTELRAQNVLFLVVTERPIYTVYIVIHSLVCLCFLYDLYRSTQMMIVAIVMTTAASSATETEIPASVAAGRPDGSVTVGSVTVGSGVAVTSVVLALHVGTWKWEHDRS